MCIRDRYNANIVPVGRDQLQHLEITRDIAKKFNHLFGETFVIPEAKLKETNVIVPGTDGRKMSKSYNNCISIFADEKILRKEIMGIVTDSKGLNESKNPQQCNIFQIYQILAPTDDSLTLERKYKNGTIGYGDVKKLLLELILETFRETRCTFNELINNRSHLELELKKGAEIASQTANSVLKKVKNNLGLMST